MQFAMKDTAMMLAWSKQGVHWEGTPKRVLLQARPLAATCC